jgi:hypothetical protein
MIFPVCLGLFWFVLKECVSVFRFYTETESFDVLIQPKQTEDQPKQFDREQSLVIFRKFRVVTVCFGLFRNISVCFGCLASEHRNKPKKQNFFVIGFTNKPKQILSRFVSFSNRNFCLFVLRCTFIFLLHRI